MLELCECGCGKEVALKGNRFLSGHNVRVTHPMNNPTTVLKMRESVNRPEVIEQKRINALGHTHSEDTKRLIRESQIGERGYWFGKHLPLDVVERLTGVNSPAWSGGLSTLPYPALFYRISMKERIRKRDNYQCQLCGKYQSEFTQKLTIHHIDYDKENLSDDNLTSLCRSCNSKVNANRDFWYNFFSQRVPNAIVTV